MRSSWIFALALTAEVAAAQNHTLIYHRLAAVLDSVLHEDQDMRLQADSMERVYGSDSPAMQVYWQQLHTKDPSNALLISRILDEHGWLGRAQVGAQGNAALFLVVQHTDLATQEKYLPVMREAVAVWRARAPDLALLEDRVALRQGCRQIYGSQLGYDPATNSSFLSPLEDPVHVDERRARAGLPPLATYLASFGRVWDVEAYEKDLPRLERLIKERGY